MKIVAGYIRVSTDDQLEYSPDSQLELLRTYAKSHDMILPDENVFCEQEGRSGRKAEKRPEFMRMIGVAKQSPPPFEVILVWKFSRFARNQEESIVYKSILQKQCGIEVVSISEPLIEGPFGSLIERIIEWMDEYYSIRLSGEVKRGMTKRVSKGEYVSGAPFGYQMIEKKLIPNPDTEETARMIFDDFLNGMGYKQIAMKLNNLGYRTKRGGQFDNRIIKYILNNPVYIGKVRWNPSGQISDHPNQPDTILADGVHKPLITMETWNRTQEQIKQIQKKYPKYAKVNTKNRYMLQGIIKCSNCNAGLIRTEKGTRFQCARYNRGTCNVSHSANVDDINTRSIDLIAQVLQSGNFKLIYRPNQSNQNSDHIQKQIERENRKLERVKEAYEAGVDTLEEYRNNKQKILSVIDRLKAQQTPAKRISKKEFAQQRLPAVKQLRDPDLTEEEKNDLLRDFVDRIVFDRTKNILTVTFYTR